MCQRLKQLFNAFSQLKHVYGVSCAIGASLFYAVGNLFTFAAGKISNPFVVFVFDSFIMMICCVVFVAFKCPKLLNSIFRAPGIIICGLIQMFGQFAVMIAIMEIGPGNGMALAFTQSIFALILGYIFIKVDVRGLHVVCSISSIAGAILVSRAYLESSKDTHGSFPAWFGISAALAAAVANASTLIARRKLSDSASEIDSIVFVFAYTMPYFVASLTLCLVSSSWSLPHNTIDLLILSGSGLNGFFGAYLCYIAVYFENPTIVSIILTLIVPLGYVGQIIVFRWNIQWLSFVGGVLIMCSCVGVALSSFSESTDREEVKQEELCDSSDSEETECETLFEETTVESS